MVQILKNNFFYQDNLVFKDIDPIFAEIFNSVAKNLARSRWWNLWHAILSLEYMKRIVSSEGENNNINSFILFPAIIMHDSGWDPQELKNIKEVTEKYPNLEEMNTNWTDPVFRIGHMKAGVVIAREVLEKVKYKDYLKKHGIENASSIINEILRIISVHDVGWGPGYAEGIPDMSIQGLIHHDADACFIVSGVSFWKDYKVNKEKAYIKKESFLTPEDYLQ